MEARLVGISGPLAGTTFPLAEESLCLGRGAVNRLQLADPSVSREHCRIDRRNNTVNYADEFVIRDLGSRTGTRVNGVPVTEQVLHDGDFVSLGASDFAVTGDSSLPRLEAPVEFENEPVTTELCLNVAEANYANVQALANSTPVSCNPPVMMNSSCFCLPGGLQNFGAPAGG